MPPAKKSEALTPLELEIMQILWQHGASTVAEVQPHLRARLAYTTVQTMLNVLLRKKKVARVQDGRAFRYRAAVSRERATGGALHDLVRRMFGGSPEAMLMAMVDTRQITAEELERVAKRLAQAERSEEHPAERSEDPAERSDLPGEPRPTQPAPKGEA